MTLQNVVVVDIALEAAAVSRAGLGTPMLPGHNAPFVGKSKSYSSAADMLLDGYLATEWEYLAAVAIFSQNPAVSVVKAGNMDAFVAQVDTFEVTLPADVVWTLTIDGEDYATAALTGSATAEDVRDAIVALDVTGSGVVLANGVGTDDFTVTASEAGVAFSATLAAAATGTSTKTSTTANSGYVEELVAIQAVDNDWYALIIEKHEDAHIETVAAWAEQEPKLFFAQTSEAGVKTSGSTTDIASSLQSQSYLRTATMFYDEGTTPDVEASEAAWVGKKIAVDPDSASTTWAHATLSGIPINVLSTDEQTEIESRNANYYGSLGGVGATYPGKVASGEWIDTVVVIDWTKFRITEDLQQIFLSTSNRGEKVPYTDQGIQILANAVRSRLQIGVNIGHFTQFKVVAPRIADVNDADKQARLLRLSFEAELAGAIHATTISGAVVTTLS